MRINQELYETRPIAIIAAMVDPDGKDRGREWITILNRTSKRIDLAGWMIIDNKNRLLELSGRINPGATKTYKGKKLGEIKLVIVVEALESLARIRV